MGIGDAPGVSVAVGGKTPPKRSARPPETESKDATARAEHKQPKGLEGTPGTTAATWTTDTVSVKSKATGKTKEVKDFSLNVETVLDNLSAAFIATPMILMFDEVTPLDLPRQRDQELVDALDAGQKEELDKYLAAGKERKDAGHNDTLFNILSEKFSKVKNYFDLLKNGVEPRQIAAAERLQAAQERENLKTAVAEVLFGEAYSNSVVTS